MTIPVPKSASRNKVTYWVWHNNRALRKWLHSWRRNPDCNERRRYRNESSFVLGEHKHVEPMWQGGHKFELVAVPFKPFRFDGPTYDDGLVLSNWNWFDGVTIDD